MNANRQKAQADCIVEFQVIDPKIQTPTWEVYETMTIHAPTVEHLIERAHMHIGRPDRHENVLAIRLKGTMTLIHQEKDTWRPLQDTITLDLNILRERTVPIASSIRVAVGQ
jgi:hypothetical protein